MSTDTAEVTDFASLPLREKHAVMARLAAFKSAFLDYEAELKKKYGDDLFDAYEDLGTKTFSHSFGPGLSVQFTIKETKDSYSVTDRETFTDWVEDHFPDNVEPKFETVVRPAFEKVITGRLEAQDDGTIIDTETGLEVPGVTFRPGGIARSNGFAPSWKGGADAKQAALAEVLGAPVESILPVLTDGSEK